jgi:pimeloyl-ACP methyl ester carboxylesterase
LVRREEALALIEDVEKLAPSDRRVWSSKAVVLLHQRRYEEAYTARERATALAPDDENVRDIAARILPAVKRDVPDQRITLRDGRTQGYVEVGNPDGVPVFFFHGLPGSRLDGISLDNTCRALHIRLICPDQPGMGLSDYQRRRRLLDRPPDVAQLADALGVERFVVAGVSGGGPYALACAYALPERVLATGLISSGGPVGVHGALRAMPWRNRFSVIVGRLRVWPLLRIGAAASTVIAQRAPESTAYRYLWHNGDERKFMPPSQLQPLPSTQREAILEPFHQGGRGVAREALIVNQRWGFRLEHIKPPVLLWHGELDSMTPVVFAEYFAAHIPTCQPTLYGGEKHGILFAHEREIFAALAKAG